MENPISINKLYQSAIHFCVLEKLIIYNLLKPNQL